MFKEEREELMFDWGMLGVYDSTNIDTIRKFDFSY